MSESDHVDVRSTGEQSELSTPGSDQPKKGPVFLFPAQGAQFGGMGRELYDVEPVFRECVDHGADLMQSLSGIDLRKAIFEGLEAVDRPEYNLRRGDFLIPLYTVSYAMSKLLESREIVPAAALGVSLGEYTSAIVAGCADFGSGLKGLWRLFQALEDVVESDMVLVFKSPGLDELNIPTEVHVAIDAPAVTVFSGEATIMADFVVELQTRDLPFHRPHITRPYHTPIMVGVHARMHDVFAEIGFQKPKIPFISNTKGNWIEPDAILDPAYFATQVCSRVRLSEGLEEIYTSGFTTFIEIGPGRQMLGHLYRNPSWPGCTGLPTMRGEFESEISDIDLFQDALNQINKPKQKQKAASSDDALTAQIRSIWNDILPQGSETSDFFSAGGDSVAVLRLGNRIKQELGVTPVLQDFFRTPTLAGLVKQIKDLQDITEEPIPRGTEQSVLPLTPAQRGVWFLEQSTQTRNAYHIPLDFTINGPLHIPSLLRCLRIILHRHQAFRVIYRREGDEPVQSIQANPNLPLTIADVTHMSQEAITQLRDQIQFTPFSLDRELPLRAFLLIHGPNKHTLAIAFHHLSFDGWSRAILAQELGQLYDALAQNEPPPHYDAPSFADYILWEANDRQQKAALHIKQRQWWREQLNGVTPLALPEDHPRPPLQTYNSGCEYIHLGGDLTERLLQFARQHQLTPYHVLMTAFHLMLYRFTGDPRPAIGSPVSSRRRSESEAIQGFFVNALTIRGDLAGDPDFETLAARTRQIILDAFDHQEAPFEHIAAEVAPQRDLSRNPVFQIMVAWQQEDFVHQSFTKGEVDISIDNDWVNKMASRFDMETHLWLENGSIQGPWLYNKDLFKAQTVAHMLQWLRNMLTRALSDPGRTIAQITAPLAFHLPTKTPAPAPPCILTRFREIVQKQPHTPAIFCEEAALDFESLNQQANRLAHFLSANGFGPENPVAALLPRNHLQVIAFLAALKAGAPWLPLDPAHPAQRRQKMQRNARVEALLEARDGGFTLYGEAIPLEDQPVDDPPFRHHPENTAYMVFTSGSTGHPKGVTGSHRCLAWLMDDLLKQHPLPPASPAAWYAAQGFDVAIQEMLFALLSGATLHPVPQQTRREPATLARFIQQHQIQIITLPFSVLDLLAAEDTAMLQSLRVLQTSGERLRLTAPIRALVKALPHLKLVNQYGPSEAHVVTEATITATDGDLPLIGHPLNGAEILVLDPEGMPAPAHGLGEIVIGGPQVASGYLHAPAITAARFTPVINHPGRWYRTGDLGRITQNGQIQFVGRRDDQVKIRGVRVECAEVENALSSLSYIERAVVLARQDARGDHYLAAWIEGAAIPLDHELRQELLRVLPENFVPSRFIRLDTMPLTPNGKVDRQQLPVPPEMQTNSRPPETALETLLVGLWSELLNRAQAGVEDNFFTHGGHSLLATVLTSRLRRDLGIDLPVRHIFEAPTPASLAQRIESHQRKDAAPFQSYDIDRPVPASFAQNRIWFIQQMGCGNAYHVPALTRLRGALSLPALNRALTQLIARHEALRTRFHQDGGECYQTVSDHVKPNLTVIDLSQTDGFRLAQNAVTIELNRPFDLSAGPLLRLHIWRLHKEDHLFLAQFHHIIIDGWSLKIFFRELTYLYRANLYRQTPQLPSLAHRYRDFSSWQHDPERKPTYDSDMTYWRNHLKDLPALNLPTDMPRPQVESFRGAQHRFHIDASITRNLKTFSDQNQVTLFITLLTGFLLLLRRLSGQDRVAVGSPIANRNRSEIENLLGFFVNSLVMDADFSDNPDFCGALAQVRERALKAYNHQDLPFEALVEALRPERNLSRNPLFQVVFALQEEGLFNGGPQSAELEAQIIIPDPMPVRFDIEFHLFPYGDGLEGLCIYNRDLFQPESITRFAQQYLELINQALSKPRLPAHHHALNPGVSIESGPTPALPNLGVHQLFQKQAHQHPHRPALIWQEQSLSYKELDQRANHLAHKLMNHGVGPESTVAVISQRAPRLIIAMLAILKAGGVYLPLSNRFPPARIKHLLSDASARLILADQEGLDHIGQTDLPIIMLNEDQPNEPAEPINTTPHHHQGAYIVYTSGSSGQPKGVLATHQNIVRLVHQPDYADCSGHVLLISPVTFDAVTFEIWGPLSQGGTLVLAPPNAHDPQILADVLKDQVDTLFITCGLFHVIAEHNPSAFANLKQLLTGGEVIQPTACRQVLEANPDLQLIACYGPTEATTFTTTSRLSHANPPKHIVPLGRPISHTTTHVIDQNLLPLPHGGSGQLACGGPGLARGYLNQPALTAARFVPDPFSSQPGARFYLSGDRARVLHDGQLGFIDRIDHQLKIRGFRVEPGEIETQITSRPGVHEALVLPEKDAHGVNSLSAAFIPDLLGTSQEEAWRLHTQTWAALFDDLYQHDQTITDPLFNTTGWRSNYDQSIIPIEQMRTWATDIVDRALAGPVNKVLEVGCGTGMLAFQIAPHCDSYTGTDISSSSLAYMRRQIDHNKRFKNIQLHQQPAHVWDQLGEAYDLIILSSVVQYFPDDHYLEQILAEALQRLSPNGRILLADLRSLSLMAAFHHELHPDKDASGLQRQMDLDRELYLHPQFFTHLKKIHPGIGVRLVLQKGASSNEMSRFRYHAIIEKTENPVSNTGAFEASIFTQENIAALLKDQSSPAFGLTDLLNRRTKDQTAASRRIFGQEPINSAGPDHEPDQLIEIAHSLGYYAEAVPALSGEPDRFDLWLAKGGQPPAPLPTLTLPDKLTNRPLLATLGNHRVSEVKDWLHTNLPDYMQPARINWVKAWPLNNHGKIDRPILQRILSSATPIATEEKTENPCLQVIAGLMAKLLRLDHVGPNDNFFALGGHSLLAIRLVSGIREELKRGIPLKTIFETPTPNGIAHWLDHHHEQAPMPPNMTVLRKTGALKPLFFCPPGGGSPTCYLDLIKYIPDRPVYGFTSPGLTDDQPIMTDLQPMAIRMAEAIQLIQPDGPIHILGWSFGAPFAFAVAAELEKRGRKLGHVGIIDGAPIPENTRYQPWNPIHFLFVLGMVLVMGLKTRLPRSYKDLRLYAGMIGVSLPRKARDLLRFSQLRQLGSQLLTSIKVYKTNTLAALHWTGSPLKSPMTLYSTPGRMRFLGHDPLELWSRFAHGHNHHIHLKGNHMSIMMDPRFIPLTARKIKAELVRVEAKGGQS